MLHDILNHFTNPTPVDFPSNRLLTYRVGVEWNGIRPLLVIPMDRFGRLAEPRLLPASIRLDAEGIPVVTDPLRRLIKIKHSSRGMDGVWEEVWAAKWVDLYLPYQAFVLEREVELDSRIDREAVPYLCRRHGLVIDWTSKSHPLRQAAVPELVEEVGFLLPAGGYRPDRVFRELRSLLKNGLPLAEPDNNRFGKVLREVTVAAVPMRGARTDVIYATQSGQHKLRAVRRFRVPEPDFKVSFAHCAEETDFLIEAEPVGEADTFTETTVVRGSFTVSPQTGCRVVTSCGLKGFAIPCRQQYCTADGTPIDLIVDVRSVEAKSAWAWFPQESDNLFVTQMYAGVTDHAQHYHRAQEVAVRPELHMFGKLRIDPIDALKPSIRRAESILQIARDLGLTQL